MEFVKFKVDAIRESSFTIEFTNILRDLRITCHQREYQRNGNFSIIEIPKYVIDKMTEEQISLLESFIAKKP